MTSIPDRILRVAVSTPLRKLFDYLPPADSNIPIVPGLRVLLPFGSQEKVGIIIEIVTTSDYPAHKLKKILKILDTTTLFPKTMFELIHWASRYYHEPLGEVIDSALPNYLRKAICPKPISFTFKERVNPPISYVLNSAQEQAVLFISNSLKKFKTFLLEGITGSGKTEVYIRVIEEALKQSKQALILVPEIGLTPELLIRFEARFNVPIVVLHSGLTPKQRYKAWELARTGIAGIIIGTRSAVFTPLANPGVFIIDEEHDPSFKQQEGFRYHARDLMIKRASLEDCPVVLGSATPALETLYNVCQGKFQRLRLETRAGIAKPPTLQILDIRHKKLEEGLSQQLMHVMRNHLNQNGQVLLFLNRRGFAPVLMCFECGWLANCKHCDAKMTFHFKTNNLKCHHCDWTIACLKECPSCQHKVLSPVGLGTERLEGALQRHFPEKNIIRLDRDTTTRKGSMQSAVQKVHDGEAHILLGTQMIAKGHHFPNVTLVAILNVDQGLFSTDYRSLERMGQLITQVAGRAGRAERLGHVILQTCHPEHPSLTLLLKEGYSAFANTLLIERQSASLPPYSYQVLFRAEAKNSEKPMDFLQFIKALLKDQKLFNITIFGPAAAPMERREGRYRAQLLLQTTTRSKLQNLLPDLISKIELHPITRTVRWSVDVDPIEMF